MSLYDLLACPTCKVHVERHGASLTCPQCGTTFPVVEGVPIMFADGSNPAIEHEAELHTFPKYNPWVHRIILQSLLDDQVVLDVGSGNMALDDPCIIRMDVKWSPHVDLVGDIHALPFLPDSLDYIFSLAVFEHLRNPFIAAQELYATLKDGGYVYHECNFVFPYHGYPHHYFNATLQGMEQVFQHFTPLRKGVATYQMPSFALSSIIGMYVGSSQGSQYPHGRRLLNMLNRVLEQDLMDHDIYFTEDAALRVAAGTFFSGYKQETPSSSLIPEAIQQAWRDDESLQARMPDMNNLTVVDNVLRWAKEDGSETRPSVAAYLDRVQPFSKRGADAAWNRDYIHGLDYVPANFGAIGYEDGEPLPTHAQHAEAKYRHQRSHTKQIRPGDLFRANKRKAAVQDFLYYWLDRLEG